MDERSQIGFLAFDYQLHFIDLSNSNPKIVTCSENPFPYNLVFNIKEYKENIIDFLEKLENMFVINKNHNQSSCLY